MTISEILDAERQSQGLSYAELSRRSGVQPSTVYDILTGRRPDPQYSTLSALLVGMGRHTGWLHTQEKRAEKTSEKITQ